MSLPLSYFEARQVGQSVAQVRELDTIRNFITGTALTLVIDLFFTIVFFAVMWLYSPTLTVIVLQTKPSWSRLLVEPQMQRKWEDQLTQKEERQQMDLFRWMGEKWKARAQLGDKRISQHEIDFLPAALEIRERPPHPASRVTAWTILPLFSIGVCGLVWEKAQDLKQKQVPMEKIILMWMVEK